MQNNSKTIGILVVGVLVVGVLAYLLLVGSTSTTINPVVTETPAQNTNTVKPVTTTTEREVKPVATTTLSVEEESSVKVEEQPVPAPAVVVPTKPVVTTQPPVVVDPAPVVETPAPVAPAVVGISMSAVATHNNANSCWSAIDGKVYDLTTYIPKHPGGKSEILAICGKDGSSLFSGQHEGQSKPERILAGYYVDVVAK